LLAGPLLEQPLSEVTDGIHTYAVSHWLFAKAVLPLLKDSPASAYLIISGAGGKQAPFGLCSDNASLWWALRIMMRS
jgi:hypothetical protein